MHWKFPPGRERLEYAVAHAHAHAHAARAARRAPRALGWPR
jgi:hypothetical protein